MLQFGKYKMNTNQRINQLIVENESIRVVNAGLASGRDKVVAAANELGYQFSTEVSPLEYLIETARASGMVNQKNVELQAQLVAVQDSVVHGKCANSEPCATFCEAIATRKMFKQLQVERDALAAYALDAERWFNKHDPQGYVSPKRAEVQAVLAAHDAEVAKAAFIAGYKLGMPAPLHNVNGHAENYAAQLHAKVGKQ